jgi:hypothetical protein
MPTMVVFAVVGLRPAAGKPIAMDMGNRIVLVMLVRRKPRVRMGNRRQQTGEMPQDHE